MMNAEDKRQSAAMGAIDAGQLEEQLHALSQPVTAVSVALCVASISDSPAERMQVLQAAQSECDRIIVEIRRMREDLQIIADQPTPLNRRAALHIAKPGGAR